MTRRSREAAAALARRPSQGPIPEGVTDRVLLRRARGMEKGQIVHGWAGDWPPPVHLIRAQQGLFGVRLVEDDDRNHAAIEACRADPNTRVSDFWLFRVWEVDTPEPLRCAEYLYGTSLRPRWVWTP